MFAGGGGSRGTVLLSTWLARRKCSNSAFIDSNSLSFGALAVLRLGCVKSIYRVNYCN